MSRRSTAVLVASLALAGPPVLAVGRGVADPPVVRILQPLPDAVVRAHPVLVRGTIEPPDVEGTVRVGGRPVILAQHGAWATLMDLPAGGHTLTAELRAAGRLLSRAEVRVRVAGPVPEQWPLFLNGMSWAGLGAGRDVPIGTPPFAWPFFLHPRIEAEGELDPEGLGRIARPFRRGEEYRHRFETPGVYTPTLRYTDAKGQPATQQALLVVFDRDWLERLLQARWRAFVAAMAQGDLEAVRRLVRRRDRVLYEVVFEELGPRERQQWAAGLGPLRLEGVAGVAANCTSGVGESAARVYFELDQQDGQWRLTVQ